jgi:hypothetical protein
VERGERFFAVARDPHLETLLLEQQADGVAGRGLVVATGS